MLRQFKRRAHLYCPHVPHDNQTVEWLALMQHYGAPTRFVDFTHSFFTALYFAVAGASSDGAVWAVQHHNLMDKFKTVINDPSYDKSIGLDRNDFHIDYANKIIGMDVQQSMVLNVEPERLNERLVAQQGLFLVPSKIDVSFQENLSGMFGLPNSVWNAPPVKELPDALDILNTTAFKIVIQKSLMSDVIRQLQNANTTALTMFPGLDGYAKSLHFHLNIV